MANTYTPTTKFSNNRLLLNPLAVMSGYEDPLDREKPSPAIAAERHYISIRIRSPRRLPGKYINRSAFWCENSSLSTEVLGHALLSDGSGTTRHLQSGGQFLVVKERLLSTGFTLGYRQVG